MSRTTILATVFTLTCLGAKALAGDSSDKPGASARHADFFPTAPCCPDNYCKKPMPRVPCPNWCGTPDNYCEKPMPCVPCPNWCGCPGNYCKKPCPSICLTRLWQFYRCPPCECELTVNAKPPAASKPAPSPPKPLPGVK
jgi:hypothetical protein